MFHLISENWIQVSGTSLNSLPFQPVSFFFMSEMFSDFKRTFFTCNNISEIENNVIVLNWEVFPNKKSLPPLVSRYQSIWIDPYDKHLIIIPSPYFLMLTLTKGHTNGLI